MNLLRPKSLKDKKQITNVCLIQITKCIFKLGAYVWFAFFSLCAFLDFQEEKTGLNQFLKPVKALPLPSITVCSQEIFQNITHETTADNMLSNLEDYLFKKTDLLHENFNKWNVWHLHEIFSANLGLCLTLQTKIEYDGRNFYSFFIRLPPNKKFQV